jgi:hypothetical protein
MGPTTYMVATFLYRPLQGDTHASQDPHGSSRYDHRSHGFRARTFPVGPSARRRPLLRLSAPGSKLLAGRATDVRRPTGRDTYRCLPADRTTDRFRLFEQRACQGVAPMLGEHPRETDESRIIIRIDA